YFVSYYDYYQPEAYIPQTDTYIQKDAKINEEIDRLRHAAVQDLLQRKDIIVIASVSCIYNIGSPTIYQKVSLEIKRGQKIKRKKLISHLISLQYQRNDIDFKPGTFRVRGNIVDIYLITGKQFLRIEFSGDKVEKLLIAKSNLNPKYKVLTTNYKLFPAHFWVTPEEKLSIALENIRFELQEQLKKLKKQEKLLEAQRLKRRTNYDLELLEETGFCSGIENYSRHFDGRKPGEQAFCLLDFFGDDFLLVIDESHVTMPQMHGMYKGDHSRKKELITYGFRLPSAFDNRPLKFEEFEKYIKNTIFASATPSEYERKKSFQIVEQLVRPTGLVDPPVEVRPTKNQMDDLISEINKRAKKDQRVLVTTLTKRMAEDLAEYLSKKDVKVRYMHSEIEVLQRTELIRQLRLGEFDVLVGINLLREGLDIPEVALVAILDADKEGFLRN
ncbi:MAG: excinuclease ABC subunit B, partial [Sulfurimonas sp.]|nr:excinuclease ABC subunit B [Sulfurimonas sp.]